MRITAASGFVFFLVVVGPVFATPALAQSFLGEWTATAETPDGTLLITYEGVVSGDTFTGTVDLGGFAQAPSTGVRIKR